MLMVQTIFPINVHLHHGASSELDGHEHIVDSHLPTDIQATQEHLSKDIHILKTTPDVISKQNTDTGFFLALMICLTVVLSGLPPIISRRWQTKRNRITHFLYYDLAPPLRAPPVL